MDEDDINDLVRNCQKSQAQIYWRLCSKQFPKKYVLIGQK